MLYGAERRRQELDTPRGRRGHAAAEGRGRARQAPARPWCPSSSTTGSDDPVAGIAGAVELVAPLTASAAPAATGDLADDCAAWPRPGWRAPAHPRPVRGVFEYHREPGSSSLDAQLPGRVARGASAPLPHLDPRGRAALLDDRFKRSVPGLLDSRLRVGHLDRERRATDREADRALQRRSTTRRSGSSRRSSRRCSSRSPGAASC